MSLEEEVKLLVKDRAKSQKLWGRCPEDLQIAAYVDGTVDGATRQSLERHFSDCAHCLNQVSFLVRAHDWPAAESAPPWLITKAERLAVPRPKTAFKFDWRWATATVAVSFAIIFAVMFAVRFRTSNTTPDRAAAPSPTADSKVVTNSTPAPKPLNPNVIAQSSPVIRTSGEKREKVPVTRNSETTNGVPNLISPLDGSVLKRGAMVFTWQKVPDVAFYDVSIMTPSGDLVTSRQTETEAFQVSRDLPLQAGTRYFASVRAHLRDGRTIRSSVVSFRVID